jgi:hypothetical protein
MSVVTKKGLSHLFEESSKKPKSTERKLENFKSSEITLPKLVTQISSPNCEIAFETKNQSYYSLKIAPTHNRIQTSHSIDIPERHQNPEIKRQVYSRGCYGPTNTKRFQYDSILLEKLLHKHKGFIKVIDKRVRFNTFQN